MIGSMCQGTHNMPENMLHTPGHLYNIPPNMYNMGV